MIARIDDSKLNECMNLSKTYTRLKRKTRLANNYGVSNFTN